MSGGFSALPRPQSVESGGTPEEHVLTVPSPAVAGTGIDTPKAIILNGVVHFQGRITFTGPSTYFEIEMPEGVGAPIGQPIWPMRGSSAPLLATATVYAGGPGGFTLGIYYADFAEMNGDDIDLAGGYVLDPAA